MQVAALYRHPIKSHGREQVESVTLAPGQTMPWDRTWAVTHEASKFDRDNPEWVSYQNFMLGTRTPGLAGIWAELDEDAARITLRHRDLGTLTFQPEDPAEAARFIDWVAPLCPEGRARPAGIARVPGRGMTDTPYPSISVMNMASHHAVATVLGGALEPERWRGNIWLDGAPAWAEFDWLDRDLSIGEVRLRLRERIRRCLHTAANPETGERDADTLGTLTREFGHKDFGIYAEVTQGGTIRTGDRVELA
jgi:uncharacterized protein